MLPRLWAPRDGELPTPVFDAQPPRASDADIAEDVITAAAAAWQRTADDPRISDEFRQTAREAHAAVIGLRPGLVRLPVL